MHGGRKAAACLLLVLLCGLGMSTVTNAARVQSATLKDTNNNITLLVNAPLNLVQTGIENGVNTTNVTYNITGANFSIASLNFTTPNSTAYSWQFPNISASSGNGVLVLNGLSQNVTATIIVGTNGVGVAVPLLTFPDGSTSAPSYNFSNGSITLMASFPPGVTTLFLNTVPNLSVSLAYTRTTPDTTLQGVVFVHDLTGRNVTVRWSWYLGGILYSTGSTANVVTNQSVNVANLSGVFTQAQQWLFSATVDNGFSNSTPQNSSSVNLDASSSGGAGGDGGSSGSAWWLSGGSNTSSSGNASLGQVNASAANLTAAGVGSSVVGSSSGAAGSSSGPSGFPLFLGILGVALVVLLVIASLVLRRQR